MPSVRVKENNRVNHSGTMFEAGDVIGGLTRREADQLIQSEVADRANDGDKASTGKKSNRQPSQIKEDLLGTDLSQRKTVTEKAQARAQADAEREESQQDEEVDELPVSFKVGETEYTSSPSESAADGFDYFKDGEAVSEEQYRDEYQQSLVDAATEDPKSPEKKNDSEDPHNVQVSEDGKSVTWEVGEDKYKRGISTTGQTYFSKNGKNFSKVEALQVVKDNEIKLPEAA